MKGAKYIQSNFLSSATCLSRGVHRSDVGIDELHGGDLSALACGRHSCRLRALLRFRSLLHHWRACAAGRLPSGACSCPAILSSMHTRHYLRRHLDSECSGNV